MEELAEMLAMLIQLYVFYTEYMKLKKRKRRWWVRPLNTDREIRGYFVATYQQMKLIDPELFFEHTRMSRDIYELLLTLIEDSLRKKSIRVPIDWECRLAITLSFLSQGVTPKFLAWSYKVGKSTVRRIILDTCETLWKVLSPVYVSQPTKYDYRLISREFEQLWDLPNCIGAIDGKHIQIQAPPDTGSLYYNYKKNFSIVLLATCDAKYTFTHVSVGAYGSQSDGGILNESTFGKHLMSGTLPIPENKILPNSTQYFPHFFVGDAAFPLRINLMRPYPGKNITASKDICNYRLSRARRIIENSFGILVARWRVLKNSLCMFPQNAEKVVLDTIALHNFIHLNDNRRTYNPPRFTDWEDEDYVVHSGEWREQTKFDFCSGRSQQSNENCYRLA